MSTNLALKYPAAERENRLLSALDQAHSQIESRFLDSGAILVNSMEVLNTLVGLLDGVTGSMDRETTQAMVTNLQQPVSALSALPACQQTRLAKFEDLYQLSTETVDKIAEMHLIIRYMQTFAVTAKITSAGISDFATFAEEIRERIRSGAGEVGNLDRQITQMRAQLQKALKFSETINRDFEATIPQIVANLSTKTAIVETQHDRLVAIADDVRKLASSFQNKIGSVLSSLQIGDITRQRIEHVRDLMTFLDGFLDGPAGRGLAESDQRALRGSITQLAKAQLDSTVSEFTSGCSDITRSIASFKADAAKILGLRDRLTGMSQEGGQDIMLDMKADILKACDLVSRVQSGSDEANAIVESVTSASRELVRGVGMIRGIQSDIHYMSLNTNLRSSKLGDSGKSVKVVSDELRKYSEELDVAAEGIVVEFEKLNAIADFLGAQTDAEIANLAEPLTEAVSMLNQMDSRMKAGLTAFSDESLTATARLEREISRLDFQSQLGETLAECLQIVKGMATGTQGADSKVRLAAQSLNQQIYSIYTMRQERDIHQRIFPLEDAGSVMTESTSKPVATSDDDLFADALF